MQLRVLGGYFAWFVRCKGRNGGRGICDSRIWQCRSGLGGWLKGDALICFEDGGDGGEEVEGGVEFVFAVGGPGGAEAEVVSGLEPKGNLLDCRLFEIVRERRLALAGGGAGEDVAAGVGDGTQG